MPTEFSNDYRHRRSANAVGGDFAARRQRRLVGLSLAFHALFVGWLLHSPAPRLLMPSSVALGENGTSVTRLYWPSRTRDDSSGSSPDSATEVYRRQRLAHQRLIWKKNSKPAKQSPVPLSTSEAESNSKTSTISNLGHGAAAGLPYGTLGNSSMFGDEIRPALPITTSDPVVYPWERPESEGNVVVEITIDERGEIVHKTVLESVSPDLNNKVLAALENWHFRPATRNGVAIASKQDAIFHFRPRG